jgi:uncharacterized membrane protein
MTPQGYFAWSIGLSAAGTLFAGYLSAVKLFTQGCAFDEPCPYFVGYPACYFGFGMFAALLVLALLGRSGKPAERDAKRSILLVAALGTTFAGYFVIQEVANWFAAGAPVLYGFGLPTCMYGLVFYVALLVLSLRNLTR